MDKNHKLQKKKRIKKVFGQLYCQSSSKTALGLKTVLKQQFKNVV